MGRATSSVQTFQLKSRWLSLGLGLALLLCATPGLTRSRKGSVDYLALASVLAADGNYERAMRALDQVDTESDAFDGSRFRLVRGIIFLNQQLFEQAAEDFETAVRLTKERQEQDKDAPSVDPVVYVYLGQAYFYSQEYEKALSAMEEAGPRADEVRSTFTLRAEALWKLERFESAWTMLQRGKQKFPDYHEIGRRQVFYAIDRKLFHLAVELGTQFLERTDAGYEDYLRIGNALRRAGDTDEALTLLELARLKAPDTPEVSVELARAYQQLEQYRTAAELMERVGHRGLLDAFLESAELYRQAGDLSKSLSLNQFIPSSKDRLRQRLLVLLDLQDYEALAAMALDLKRVQLLEDENIRYAVAYAFFEIGNFEQSEFYLAKISKPDLFRKAAELRRSMAACRAEPLTC